MKGRAPGQPIPIDESLLAFCYDGQREIVQAVIDHGGASAAARVLGKSRSSVKDVVCRVRKRAEEAGWRPPGTATAAARIPNAGRPVPSPGKPLTDAARFLVDLAQKGPLNLEDACNKLGWPPAAVRKLAGDAAAAGYAVQFVGEELAWRVPEPSDEVQETAIAPVVGRRHEVAIISDLHFGSKWCGRAQLRDFLNRVRDRGITQILGPGDNLDGNYKFSLYEQSHHGFDEQAEDFYELWRDYPELHFHTIDGNHDQTLSESCGMLAGRALGERLRDHGVTNYTHYGQRSAFLNIYGAVVHLWHPSGSGSYALSYKLQKKVEGYAPGQKPDILATGHFHQGCYIIERGVHGLLCSTFQLPGSPFGNSLTGSPSVGGTVLGWELTENRTLRNVVVERVNYYAEEKPRLIAA